MELLEALHNTSHVASTSELKSIAYYQMLYVRQGKSGLFRDLACYEMLQRDAYAAQEALAQQFVSSCVEQEDQESDEA